MRVIIIGAGIVGASIARILSKFENLEIHLLEKAPDVGWGASKANTAIIHPGHEEDPGEFPLRAKLCVKGNRIWHRWVQELEIPAKWPGELMVALNNEDLKTARQYLQLAQRNGVPEVQILRTEEIHELAPHVTPEAVGGLWAPSAGQIAPWEAVIALVENAVENGVHLHVETKVEDILHETEIKAVETTNGTLETDIVVNAAGLYADEVSKMAGIHSFSIRPRRGEYYLFDEQVASQDMKILHPTPTEKTKGVYVISTVEGNLMIGPTAQDLQRDEKENTATTEEGLQFIRTEAKKLIERVPPRKKVMKTFAGLRPEPPEGNWIIKGYDAPWGFINVAGMRSPGFTGAPAIAQFVKRILQEELGIPLRKKDAWQAHREAISRFHTASPSTQAHLVKQDPKYGNVVCMCKEVTEAEIRKAVERMQKIGIKTITLDGIKFRTLAMFGTCQGAFCRIRIAKILSKKLDIPMWALTLRGKGTEYGIGDVKSLQKQTTSGDESNAK